MTFPGIVTPLHLFHHDLFGKPVPTFPDHALVGIQGRSQGLIRQQVVKIGDRLNKTLLELRPRSPGEFLIGHRKCPDAAGAGRLAEVACG